MRSQRVPAEEQYCLIMECRQSGLTDPQRLAQTLRIVKELEC